MTYIDRGKRNHVYIWKFEGKSQYVQKHYLLWKLRHVLDMEIKFSDFQFLGFQNDSLSFQERFEK